MGKSVHIISDRQSENNSICSQMGIGAKTMISKEELYKIVVNRYGITMQLIVAIEECSELTKELTKILRGVMSKNKNVIRPVTEEIADVLIMCEQLQYIFDNRMFVQSEMSKKLIRLRDRLGITDEIEGVNPNNHFI